VKTSNMRRTLFAALTGLTLAAITQVSYAARDVASETQIAQFTPATAIAEPRSDRRGSPLTLYIEDASGNPFRLVHVQGTGWKYAEGWKSLDGPGNWLFRKTAFGSTTPARAANAAIPDDEPLTVFIDGPTGFTYVWNRNGGWQFVGKVADRSP
jgi:hypothetical protein